MSLPSYVSRFRGMAFDQGASPQHWASDPHARYAAGLGVTVGLVICNGSGLVPYKPHKPTKVHNKPTDAQT